MVQMEEWRKIDGYPNYSVSNLGNVRNDKTGKALKRVLQNRGYYQIGLYTKGTGAQPAMMKVSRVVAQAFIPNPLDHPIVDHIDRDKANDSVSNLRWCTSQQNNRNRTKSTGTSSRFKGVRWDAANKRWKVTTKINYRNIHIGVFEDETEAASAYNEYVRSHGLDEFFVLNVI